MIFFDNAGTTKADKECKDIMEYYSFDGYYNPSAPYWKSTEISNDIKRARKSILHLLGGEGQFIFTSSGTESNNLAMFGVKKKKGARIIISESEHPAIMNCAMELKQLGYDIAVAEVDCCGRVIFDKFKSLITENTELISIMHINNETGGINDIKMLSDYAKSKNPNLIFHSDGVQALGKIPINLSNLNVDLYSVSSHKIHSIKGCGGLFIKKGVILRPILFGGGQENEMRSSTENVPSIMCFAHMLEKQVKNMEENSQQILKLKNCLLADISNNKNYISISDADCSPYIVGMAVKDVRGEVMLHSLEQYGIMIGTGSACSSSKAKRKNEWKINSLAKEYKNGLIRISFSSHNTLEEVEYYKTKLNLEYSKLKKYLKG